jgi:hypothetical protein
MKVLDTSMTTSGNDETISSHTRRGIAIAWPAREETNKTKKKP